MAMVRAARDIMVVPKLARMGVRPVATPWVIIMEVVVVWDMASSLLMVRNLGRSMKGRRMDTEPQGLGA